MEGVLNPKVITMTQIAYSLMAVPAHVAEIGILLHLLIYNSWGFYIDPTM